MNFIVYEPENPEQGEALRERISAVHAQAVIQSLASLSCSNEQKLYLLEEIERNYRAGRD